mmetsp:Transcript_22473/g.69412  ORF Transcript_22473/g.69412 Transcript_22473/m.69412 type:complete len:295 (+) Transcript_22473:222-1106(+)
MAGVARSSTKSDRASASEPASSNAKRPSWSGSNDAAPNCPPSKRHGPTVAAPFSQANAARVSFKTRRATALSWPTSTRFSRAALAASQTPTASPSATGARAWPVAWNWFARKLARAAAPDAWTIRKFVSTTWRMGPDVPGPRSTTPPREQTSQAASPSPLQTSAAAGSIASPSTESNAPGSKTSFLTLRVARRRSARTVTWDNRYGSSCCAIRKPHAPRTASTFGAMCVYPGAQAGGGAANARRKNARTSSSFAAPPSFAYSVSHHQWPLPGTSESDDATSRHASLITLSRRRT